ncbi:hypothetical protein VTN02DRAFT_1070 [Thermoascus thermophilus]
MFSPLGDVCASSSTDGKRPPCVGPLGLRSESPSPLPTLGITEFTPESEGSLTGDWQTEYFRSISTTLLCPRVTVSNSIFSSLFYI